METLDSYFIKDLFEGGVNLINSGSITKDNRDLIELHKKNKMTAILMAPIQGLQRIGVNNFINILDEACKKSFLQSGKIYMTEFKEGTLFWIDKKLMPLEKKLLGKILREKLT